MDLLDSQLLVIWTYISTIQWCASNMAPVLSDSIPLNLICKGVEAVRVTS